MGTWHKTEFKGVRYRKHPTRKHGVQFDRYYVLTYKLDGKTKSEGYGWASDGKKPSEAFDILRELKKNQKTGKSPCTMAEMRQESDAKKEAERKKREAQAKLDITFKDFAEDEYFPVAILNWKDETARKHKEHCKNWLYPKLGNKSFRAITLNDLKKVLTALHKAKDKNGRPKPRSARTMQAVFRTFDMIWSAAHDAEIVTSKSPTKMKSFKLPKIDNQRERFLSFEEADMLLAAVKKRSQQSHDMALLALHTGMRFSEIANLSWGRVDLEARTSLVLNANGDKSRTIELGEAVNELFEGMDRGKNGQLIFPNQYGKVHTQVPTPFKKGVIDSKLNEGVTDPKERFGFHGLRHTRASWMRKSGSDLYTIQRVLGHSTPVVTQRYSHIEQEELRAATDAVDRMLKANKTGGKVLPIRRKVKVNE